MTERFTVENRSFPTSEEPLWAVVDHEEGQMAGFAMCSFKDVIDICDEMRRDPSYAGKFIWRPLV